MDSRASVQLLYRHLLNREADPQGEAAHVALLDAGGDLGGVVMSIIGSEEFKAGSCASKQVRDPQGVTTDDSRIPELVHILYEAILHRAPDEEGLAHYVQALRSGATIWSVIDEFNAARATEARDATPAPLPTDPTILYRFARAAPKVVQTQVNDDVLRHLFSQTAKVWEGLGETEPHWSVLTHDGYRQDSLDTEAFYRTGADDVAILEAFFQRAGHDLRRDVSRVLELGCGVGRVTEHFARTVASVEALDVSSAHLALAEARMRDLKLDNAHFRQLGHPEGVLESGEADLLYSVIVLQHNPPPVAAFILDQSLSKVRHRGWAFFQVPTYGQKYSFRADQYVHDPARMEMHVIPQAQVFEILERRGYRLLEVQEDAWTGDPHWVSNTFFAQRVHSA